LEKKFKKPKMSRPSVPCNGGTSIFQTAVSSLGKSMGGSEGARSEDPQRCIRRQRIWRRGGESSTKREIEPLACRFHDLCQQRYLGCLMPGSQLPRLQRSWAGVLPQWFGWPRGTGTSHWRSCALRSRVLAVLKIQAGSPVFPPVSDSSTRTSRAN
jgi:hypothetical protein